ncbi:MAG TPA: Uma2 family endonuclease [Chloroflexota bacterium]|nr:Uma2 family endonuclease [Chloroflexota bacterium]
MAVKALFTAEDLDGIQRLTGKKYELIRGELYEVTTAPRANFVTAEIIGLLRDWNRRARAGNVGGDIGFTLERHPDTVRAPDVCFVRKGRLSRERAERGYPEMAPDLVFEVRSPNDTMAALRRKAEQFLEKGSEMVVLVEPDKGAEVFERNQPPRRLGPSDMFQAPAILPGFSCRVGDFFPEHL